MERLAPRGAPAEELPSPPAAPRPPTLDERLVAVVEVLLCSDYPTQLAIGWLLMTAGVPRDAPDGGLGLAFVVTLSLLDTVALIGLIVLFLAARGESPRAVILGRGDLLGEIRAGLPLVVASIALALGVLLAIQLVAPGLHTVPHNPLQDLLRRPRDAALFGLVVVIAGGVREEVQRAFLLHRFERSLGGGLVGLVVVSVAFGAGHLIQGVDAAVATGLLGALWGSVYLRRRSAVAPMVGHAGFNLLELSQFLLLRR